MRSSISPGTAVAVAATAAALAVTHPLAFRVQEAIPYAIGGSLHGPDPGLVPGDHLQFFYYLSLVPKMAAGEVPWFHDTLQFSAPTPSDRPTFFFLPFSLLFLVAPVIGGAAAYNLLVWLSFPATALAVYALARQLGVSAWGSAFAGAAAMLLPYRIGSLSHGHPMGFVVFLLPLLFAAAERAWVTGSRSAAALAGGSAVALAVNEPHLLYFLALLVPLWLTWVLARDRHEPMAIPLVATIVPTSIAAVGPAIAWATWLAREDRFSWGPVECLLLWLVMAATLWLISRFLGRVCEDADGAAARGLLPLVALGLYGLQPIVDVPHGGKLLAAAGFIGVCVAQRRPLFAIARIISSPAEWLRLRVLWPLAAGLVIAFGFIFYWKASVLDASASSRGRVLHDVLLFSPRVSDLLSRSALSLTNQIYLGLVVAALAAVGAVRPRGRVLLGLAVIFLCFALGAGSPVWLPFHRAGFEWVPYFNWIRQSGKFIVVVALALAVGAGFGFDVLSRRAGGRTRAAMLALALAALALDFSGVWPLGLTRLPLANRAYTIVAKEGRGSNLLELPLWPGDSAYSSVYQYWATRTDVPIVNGYMPAPRREYVERTFLPLEFLNVGQLTLGEHRRLDELGVRFLSLHAHVFPSKVSAFSYRRTLEGLRANPNLVERAVDDGIFLFERRNAPFEPLEGSIPWPVGAFFEAESLRVASGRVLDDPRASGGRVVVAKPGASDETKPVVFGPYRSFPKGRYEALFRVRGRGVVDVSADHGRTPLATREVDSEAWSELALGFELERARSVELRGWTVGGSVIQLDWVLATSIDPGAAAKRIEGEKLTLVRGVDHEVDDASDGAYAELGEPAGAIARDGPYRFLRAGSGVVNVRSRGGEFLIRVESADGLRRFAEAKIPPAASWNTTSVAFDVPEPLVLATRIVALGVAAHVDYIELDFPR